MACQGEENCFTFLWKCENISYCLQKKGEVIESPAFMVDEMDQTKWRLWLFPRGSSDGNYVGYILHRESDENGPAKVEINYELAFIAKDGSVLKSLTSNNRTFSKSGSCGWTTFEKREDVFISRRSEFLSRDTLTARCRMWKSVGEMTEDVRCTALTRIGIEKRTCRWNVENFSTLEPEKKYTYQINSIENDALLMSVELSLTGDLSSEEMIHFELALEDQTIKFSNFRLSLVDALGNRVECNQEEMWFDDPDNFNQLTFFFTKQKLLDKKSIYLPNDTLSLIWEWAFSNGIVLEQIEEVQYGCAILENKISDSQNAGNHGTTLLNDLVDNVKSVYDEHFLSDVKLKTKTSVFPAHKFILAASSSVFKAMFSNDMKEKISDCVNIEDLSDDTISRMLLFVYTTRAEDLTWERASHLYVAADKYAILSLKNVCCSFLKENLSPKNACEVLLFSDFHADSDLKSSVQHYILKNGKQIINSDGWKLLMETNSKLAAETLCLIFK